MESTFRFRQTARASLDAFTLTKTRVTKEYTKKNDRDILDKFVNIEARDEPRNKDGNMETTGRI